MTVNDESREVATLQDGETLQLVVDSSLSDGTCLIHVGNGNGSDSPQDYTLEVESQADGEWRFYRQQGTSGSPATDRAFEEPALPRKMRLTLTNEASGEHTYDLAAVVYR